MAYDFYAASSVTNFAAPLYASSSDPEPNPKKRTSYNVDAAVKAYISAGVPASKLVVGVSFSGHGWEGVKNINHGLYQQTSGLAQGTWAKDGIFDFEDLKSNYVGTYLRFWSAEASVPWLYNPDTDIMISYDDSQSVGLKADYVNANSLAGMMIWQLSADDDKLSLLNTLVSILNPSQEPATAPAHVLTGSARSIPKATLVPLNVDVTTGGTSDAAATGGQAIIKFGYVRQLGLQPGEVDMVRKNLAANTDVSLEKKSFSTTDPLWDLLSSFEGKPMPSLLPSASEFMRIPVATLQTFGKALVGLRKQAVDQISAGLSIPGAGGGIALPSPIAPTSKVIGLDIGKAQHMLNLVAVANKGLAINTSESKIGMLNLERLEMAPAGIERGELIATIPLAPGERTAVVQKEWSVTTKEFTSIVTDSLENYSETGVTDNTELAQSTTSQAQHANQFNITGTVSGGFKIATDVGVSGQVNTSFGSQDSSSQSATESRKHAVATTQKASSRTKQEHKVTISTTTVTGTSEQTTRELFNPSTTDPIRIDYFSMMRKWRVRLIRYGLRLTYDIVIPEPAGALRKTYARLADLRSQIGPFIFKLNNTDIKHTDITDQKVDDKGQPTNDGTGIPKYAWLEDQFQTSVPLPPSSVPPYMWVGSQVGLNIDPEKDGSWRFYPIEFDVPDGSEISDVFYDGYVGATDVNARNLTIVGYGNVSLASHSGNDPLDLQNFLVGATKHQIITFRLIHVDVADIQFKISFRPTQQARDQWVNDVWNALYNAAQTQYYARQQDIAAQISQIEDQLNNVDTLTLRREESDEIMKGVIRFLLGPDFNFMPQAVIDAIIKSSGDIKHGGEVLPNYGVAFTGNSLGLSQYELTVVSQHEDKVRFINQAIEWENVISFLYSYFWDVPDSWDFIRQIRHPDANRQAFLRAGSARVVLTIRKGWGDAWVRFAEGGFKDAAMDPNHPYLTIAQEIAEYDDRNYPGIPPANPGGDAVRLEDAIFTMSKTQLSPPKGGYLYNQEIEVKSSAGFLVGAQVVIDSRVEAWPNPPNDSDNSGRQESTTITAIRDTDTTHITVAKIQYPHGNLDGLLYPIMQPGEKGELIAEWFEYTPSSGTDIAVTSNLTTIA